MILNQALPVSWVLLICLAACTPRRSAQVAPASPAVPAMPVAVPKPPANLTPPASATEQKLDQQLRDLAHASAAAGAGAKTDSPKTVKVEIVTNAASDVPALKEILKSHGATVTADLGNRVWASIPVSSINLLSQLDSVWTIAVSRPTSSAK